MPSVADRSIPTQINKRTQCTGRWTAGWEGKWLTASSDLANSLGIDPPNASEAEHRRIFHLYLPVFFWLKGLLEATISSAQTRDHKRCSKQTVVLLHTIGKRYLYQTGAGSVPDPCRIGSGSEGCRRFLGWFTLTPLEIRVERCA